MRKLWKKGRRQVLSAVMACVLLVLGVSMYNTYHVYVEMIQEQQQEHLLLAARAVSQSLELDIAESLKQVGILTQTPGFLDAMEAHYETGETEKIKEYIFSYMLSDQNGPSRMYLLNRSGEQIFHYNQYPFLEEFDESLLELEQSARESESGIGLIFPINKEHYGMTLLNSVYGGEGYLGTVVSVIDLNALYSDNIAPFIEDGVETISVKTADGTVIMHSNVKMLGFNEERDIAGFDELRQYDGQRSMLETQYAREEGTAVYERYSNGIVPAERELSAFSRMNLWGTSWYISASMPYERAVSIEFNTMRRLILLFVVTIGLVIAGGLVISDLMRKRKKLETETRYLKEINSTLEELHQSKEEIRHYQKLTTIGALAGGIVHEFNNLLTPILGYAEFLREQMEPDSESYQDMEEIYKAGMRAKEIVEQILPFSRKEAGAGGYKTIDLDTVIRDSVKMVRLVAPANISITEIYEDQGVHVYGNATQLHQVFLNLYSNAIQSMEGSGGLLQVRAARVRTEQLPEDYRRISGAEYVEITVSDTGCGMEEEVLKQIFNPFFTTKGAGEGTGLGLSVVQDILINHSGFAKVESSPGEGSRFSVYLPVSVMPLPMQVMAAGTVREQTNGKIRVLLVDDEERVVRYLKKRLERKGYQVDAYTEPQAALRALEAEPNRCGAAILDYMMPQMKGSVLARKIKALRPDMGIILITGLAEPDALLTHLEGVLDKILIKPLRFDELVKALKDVCGT